jgi:transcription elongation GreA/GreB family factor
MSRAFVKDGNEVADLPDRAISEHPNDVTQEGLARIEDELRAAKEAHAAAQAIGDREGLAIATRDLRYWMARRSTARVVPNATDASAVRFGHKVTILREGHRRQTFRIVGADEAEPAKGTISHVSPLARALLGKGVGDVVTVTGGKAEILSIC